MLITSNAAEIAKQVEEYKKEVRRKLESMVRGFAAELTFKATAATPMGNSAQYGGLYLHRKPSWLPNVEGFARGSWQFSMGPSPNVQILPGRSSGSDAYSKAQADAMQYSLGKTFYIINKGPYIGYLDAGSSRQAPSGIMSQLQAPQIYSINLQYHYDKG